MTGSASTTGRRPLSVKVVHSPSTALPASARASPVLSSRRQYPGASQPSACTVAHPSDSQNSGRE